MPTDDLTTKLYFGPWYRKSPFFEATRRAGCTAYDIYNHMYLPGYYDDPEVEYCALQDGVTIWDVGVERTVQISGPDADRLIDMLTCRDLTKCEVKQGKYMLVIAPDGGIVNDPVLLHVDENMWWMQLADSDAGLYALGVLAQLRARRAGPLPGRAPCAGAGADVGEDPRKARRREDLRHQYYWCDRFDDRRHPGRDQPHRLDRRSRGSRSTCSTSPAATICGTRSWRPARSSTSGRSRPCEARRIEAGIFNYGSDITLRDTPFHVMGLERLVEDQPQDYIGKAALERLRAEGVDRKLVGIEFRTATSCAPRCPSTGPSHGGKQVGHMTDAVWSPGLKQNIGYVWVPIELAEPGTTLDVESENGPMRGVTAAIPFVDPRKERPARPLERAAG